MKTKQYKKHIKPIKCNYGDISLEKLNKDRTIKLRPRNKAKNNNTTLKGIRI
jgi:hypothetical protein